MTTPELATRHIGFCAICEQDHKLTEKNGTHVLVHHGYKRPGHGYIVGDCLTVYCEPYETSCEPLKGYLKFLHAQRKGFVASIECWSTNPPSYFEETSRGWRRGDEEIHCYSRFVTCDYIFDRKIREKLDHLKWELKSLDREIARIEGWISKWEPKPVRTVEEEKQKAAEKAAERKARLAAAKKARDDKRAAIDAKHAALAARREQEKAELIAMAKKLAAEIPGKDADAKVRAAHQKAVEKLSRGIKKSPFYPQDFKIDEELIRLQLAAHVGGDFSYVRYYVY